MTDVERGVVMLETKARDASPSAVKQCCASAYDSDIARLLLGDSFHPGGTRLTERLGELLTLTPSTRVLDVAAGKGTSGLFLAQRFGCEVVGIDFSERNVEEANRKANALGLGEKATFLWADAEKLPFQDETFNAVICECAFCTFPDKEAAAHEFMRVLRPGGQVGLSDLTREGVSAPELDSLLAWVACVADAQPLITYVSLLATTRLTVRVTEKHDGELAAFVKQMRTRLLAAEVMVGLGKLSLPGVDFDAAKNIVKHALHEITNGRLGYAILTASRA